MSVGIDEKKLTANGITFTYLESGSGPLVLLLHGFPDNAWTWKDQIEKFARAGFHVVAPFLRGYPPTEIPEEPFDTEDITHDVRALIEALSDEPSFVVGHDWGGLAALNAAAVHAGSIKGVASIGVGHPATAIDIFKHPAQLHYAFHIWLFQLEGFAEYALRNDDLALVDYLWEHWSSQPVDADHVTLVKKTLNEPGAVEAALGYYRGLVRVPREKPQFFEEVSKPISIPSLVIYGADDPARLVSENERPFFTGEYRRELVPGAGHFVHREQPNAFNKLVLDWLAEDR